MKIKRIKEYIDVFIRKNILIFIAILKSKQNKNVVIREKLLRRNVHRIEKGLNNVNLKIPFANSYAKKTFDEYMQIKNFIPSEINVWAFNVLHKYSDLHKLDWFETNFAPKDFKVNSNSENKSYLIDLINNRNSVRHFDSKFIIKNDLIKEILHDVKNIPSSCNREAYKAIVIENDDLKSKVLASSIGFTNFSGTSGCALVMYVADFSSVSHPRDANTPLFDAAFSSILFSLRIKELELDSCYLNWPIRPRIDKEFRNLLDLSHEHQFCFAIIVGKKLENHIEGRSHKSGRVYVKN